MYHNFSKKLTNYLKEMMSQIQRKMIWVLFKTQILVLDLNIIVGDDDANFENDGDLEDEFGDENSIKSL